MTASLDLVALADAAEVAARAGGTVVAEGFDDPSNVREKAPGDWVSDVDHESERVVRESLLAAFPEIPFFGEESGGERGELGWICDPLDGTSNFLHRLPAVGVSIALVHAGEPIVGVVHAPLLGDTYRATLGGGAWCNGVRLSVATRSPESAIVATGFPFRRKDLADKYIAVFAKAFAAFEDVRRVGAASLDLAWTAAGVFDGYFELSLGPWDVAAGALLVREAGGIATDWAGDPSRWLASGDIVVGSPAVHARILEVVGDMKGSGERPI